uniref:Uncharacterized protein MANES_16G124100 n=1 Tax=Rhizophora mucronata TaxID=61149 RepID=A0A2P2MZW7_RHIMU
MTTFFLATQNFLTCPNSFPTSKPYSKSTENVEAIAFTPSSAAKSPTTEFTKLQPSLRLKFRATSIARMF